MPLGIGLGNSLIDFSPAEVGELTVGGILFDGVYLSFNGQIIIYNN